MCSTLITFYIASPDVLSQVIHPPNGKHPDYGFPPVFWHIMRFFSSCTPPWQWRVEPGSNQIHLFESPDRFSRAPWPSDFYGYSKFHECPVTAVLVHETAMKSVHPAALSVLKQPIVTLFALTLVAPMVGMLFLSRNTGTPALFVEGNSHL